MLDNFGREITYLRLSVTERCSLRCLYCRADEGLCPKQVELNTRDLVRIVDACADLGINRVRLTGGEPLLRRDIVQIVSGIRANSKIRDISLTTNAQMLAEVAAGLKQAGLDRVNISLDSLKPDVFHQMTGGDLEKVKAGINASIEAGLDPIKINVVLVRGWNDLEVDDFIALTRDHALDVRFIEYMPIGEGSQSENLRVDNSKILQERPALRPVPPRNPGQPSRDYQIPGYKGRVGFISPISHQFCADCNRIRVMSDGTLRTCLGQEQEISLVQALAECDEALKEKIRTAVLCKSAGHNFRTAQLNARGMSKIGG
ncbi:MAG TPA: GTP 3',8-cyclase MoaA [Anaerolineaceae bacterium]|nr:GTP 3',8-cyclase MoaA [Anaerolineaceae bacterium]